MTMLNSVLVEGNLVRDAETTNTSGGTSVTNFTIASNRFYRKGDDFVKESSYFDITAFGKLSESIEIQGYKGRGVRVVGRLKQERWEDANGNARSRIVIIAEHVEFRPEQKKSQNEEAQVSESVCA